MFTNYLFGQSSFILSGKVVEAVSGEELVGVTIIDTITKLGINTDEKGQFRLETKDKTVLSVIYIGYELVYVNTDTVSEESSLIIELIPISNLIDEVTIKAYRFQRYELNRSYLTQNNIKAVLTLGGEPDVLKSLSTTPGIKSGVEGTSNIYVRGGNSDQNLFLVEGVPIYNTSHLFGLVSIFSGTNIQSVSAYKGSFPAKYGGRLSSVVDIKLKDGNESKIQKSITLGTLSSKASINGTILKKKLHFNIFYRRNLFDLFNKLSSGGNSNGISGYNFTDFFSKITYQLNSDHALHFFTIFSKDQWARKSNYFDGKNQNAEDQSYLWGNNAYQLRAYGRFLKKGNYDFSARLNGYQSKLSSGIQKGLNSLEFVSKFEYSNSIGDNSLKLDFNYPIQNKVTLYAGFDVKKQVIVPGQVSLFQSIKDVPVLDTNSLSNKYEFYDSRLYLSGEVNWGIARFNFGSNCNFNQFLLPKIILEPRIITSITLSEIVELQANFSKTSQSMHQLSNNSLGLPTDIWIASNERVPISYSTNYSLGGIFKIGNFDLTTEVYYRTLKGLIQYKQGAGFLLTNANWADRILKEGKGHAYGLEILLKKNLGSFNGWISYTYSRSFRSFDGFNNAKKFNFQFDRPHEIDLVWTYTKNKKWEFYFNWKFSSGNPSNIPLGSIPTIYFDNENVSSNLSGSGISNELFEIPSLDNGLVDFNSVYIYGQYNKFRLPNYHRLDLGVNYKIIRKKYNMDINFSIYNLYNWKNAIYQYLGVSNDVIGIDGEPTRKISLKSFYQFPILPSLSISFNF